MNKYNTEIARNDDCMGSKFLPPKTKGYILSPKRYTNKLSVSCPASPRQFEASPTFDHAM